jgi:hypothetical protein
MQSGRIIHGSIRLNEQIPKMFEFWKLAHFYKSYPEILKNHAPFWFSGNNFVKNGQILKNQTFLKTRQFEDSKNVQLDHFWPLWNFDDFPKPRPRSPEKLEISQERLIGNLWNLSMMFPKIWPLICARSPFLTFNFALYHWSFKIFFWFSRKIQDGRQLQNTHIWSKIERAFQICNWNLRSSKIVDDIVKFQKSLILT